MRTPTLLIDESRLRANIEAMQQVCNAGGVQLWPHIKTHKTIEIARMQLEAGAAGLTFAKLGEIEALLPSGVRRALLAYPLVDPENQSARVRALAESLDEFIVAATSPLQAEALGRVLIAAGVALPVLIGVDTGLGREGVRGESEAVALADIVRRHPNMRLRGMFTHEGHAYRAAGPAEAEITVRDAVSRLLALREEIGSGDTGEPLTLWPGCSVTAEMAAGLPGVHAVRPGTYVFRDLALAPRPYTHAALTILSTVVDRPQPGLALIDAGSKTFSSDKTPDGISASAFDGRDLHVNRLSEEHGFVVGGAVDSLVIGERIRWVPAHVCPTVNLADTLTVTDTAGNPTEVWKVAARGRNY